VVNCGTVVISFVGRESIVIQVVVGSVDTSSQVPCIEGQIRVTRTDISKKLDQ
jgi:hypothetical protein